jgi:hypothetical protein
MEETRSAYRISIGKFQGKKPFHRNWRKWEDNIKPKLGEVKRE